MENAASSRRWREYFVMYLDIKSYDKLFPIGTLANLWLVSCDKQQLSIRELLTSFFKCRLLL